MLVNIKEPLENLDLLPPALAEIGVTGDVAPTPGMMMGRFYIEPDSHTCSQFNINADLAMFIVEGSGKLITGPKHDDETDTFEDKDFIYVERGEIFSLENMASSTCKIIFTYVGVERIDDLQRTFVEAPPVN
tara:strand:- start:6632 stop:7027 length:396 start_codon:yes stop_codon:yes gene_type:complete